LNTPEEKPVRSGVIEEIENLITAGYRKKEDLRATDKSLREKYYSEFMKIRHRWEKIYLSVIDAGQSASSRECKAAIQTIDRLAAVVNRADYGYASLFSRVQKINEKELANILEYDKNLAVNLDKLNQDLTNAETIMKASSWPSFNDAVDIINEDLRTFEEIWGKRKQAMYR
jgi:hypothetical protein